MQGNSRREASIKLKKGGNIRTNNGKFRKMISPKLRPNNILLGASCSVE